MKTVLLPITFLIVTTSLFAQHIKIDKKQLSFLNNEQVINVIFKYDDIKRGGDNISELKYIKKRKVKLASKGKDTIVWIQAYNDSKQKLWQEAYIEHLNETLNRYKAPLFKIDTSKTSNYSMIVDVLWIYSGYDIGIAHWPSKVKMNLYFINNKTKKKQVTLKTIETHGSNDDDDYDSYWPHLRRVENAFYNSGFKLGIALKRLFDKN